MAEFKCHGPFPISCAKRNGGGRTIVKDGFWESSEELDSLRQSIGIYTFAIKPPRTDIYTPCYVGQAKVTFEKEAFHNDKLLKYNNALADYKKGAPYIFFLAHPNTKKNLKQIGELEDYLIMMGFATNPEIQNDKGAKLPTWSISGVIRGSVKRQDKSAAHVARMFDIKSRNGV